MKTTVSSILRRLASMIVVDDTPTDEEIRVLRCTRVRQRAPGEEPVAVKKVDGDPEEYVAPPQQRRPRREHEHHKKWNETDSTGLMKDYMAQYRADGKDMETNSPKSKYVKKPKM